MLVSHIFNLLFDIRYLSVAQEAVALYYLITDLSAT